VGAAGVVGAVVGVDVAARVAVDVEEVDREVGVTAGATSFPRTGSRG